MKISLKNYNKKHIVINILSQILFGGGSIAIVVACSHFSNMLIFGRISSIFLVINLLVGIILVWITAKWRDDALTPKTDLTHQSEIIILGLLPVIIMGGVVVTAYDILFFSGDIFSPLLWCASSSSAIYAATRRNSLLSGKINNVLTLDIVRSAVIFMFIAYWSKYSVNLQLFYLCLTTAALVPLVLLRSKIWVESIFHFVKSVNNRSLLIYDFFKIFTLSKKSNSIFLAGAVSIASSQIISIMVPAIVDANSVGIVRVYELLFFPLFFGIQAIDPLVSRKMVLLNFTNARIQQIKLAIFSSFTVFTAFLFFIFFVYVCDFKFYQLGIIIPKNFNVSPYILYYIAGIGAIVSLSVGWRWIGLGWHSALNLTTGTFFATFISIIFIIMSSYYEYSIEGVFISRIFYELILLGFLTRAGVMFYKNSNIT